MQSDINMLYLYSPYGTTTQLASIVTSIYFDSCLPLALPGFDPLLSNRLHLPFIDHIETSNIVHIIETEAEVRHLAKSIEVYRWELYTFPSFIPDSFIRPTLRRILLIEPTEIRYAAIHARGNDYITDVTAREQVLANIKAAIIQLEQQEKQILFVTDDDQWRGLIKDRFPNVQTNEGNDLYEDLTLLANSQIVYYSGQSMVSMVARYLSNEPFPIEISIPISSVLVWRDGEIITTSEQRITR